MKVVFVNLSPPVGPTCAPTSFTCTRSHGIAPGVTNLESVEDPITLPQTVLVSWECCQVARMMPPSLGLGLNSKGFGLKKCVIICSLSSLNNVACGVNNV